jgi:predicted transposase YbfD/YdcC
MKNKPKQIMKLNSQLNIILIDEIRKKKSIKKKEKKKSQLG